MSRYITSVCSDEQLLEELSKLGLNNISPDEFNEVKQDLSKKIIEHEQGNVSRLTTENQDDASLSGYNRNLDHLSFNHSSSDASMEYLASQENVKKVQNRPSRKTKKKLRNSNIRLTKSHEENEFDAVSNVTSYYGDEQVLSNKTGSFENMYGDAIQHDISRDQYADTDAVKSKYNYLSQNSRMDHNRNDVENTSSGMPKEKNSDSSKNDLISKYNNKSTKDINLTSHWRKAQKYALNKCALQKTENDNPVDIEKDTLKADELERNFSESNESSVKNRSSYINLNTSDSVNSERKTIKRKVLRRRNGTSTITEELVEIPSIFDTSYPESESFNSSKSFSSDDLSLKSNNSTGSTTTISSNSSMKSSPSTLSLLSSRSTSLRMTNTRKKKSDPVAMYGYYKKYWDNFRPPGENNHDRIRFAIRDKMLEYNI